MNFLRSKKVPQKQYQVVKITMVLGQYNAMDTWALQFPNGTVEPEVQLAVQDLAEVHLRVMLLMEKMDPTG